MYYGVCVTSVGYVISCVC